MIKNNDFKLLKTIKKNQEAQTLVARSQFGMGSDECFLARSQFGVENDECVVAHSQFGMGGEGCFAELYQLASQSDDSCDSRDSCTNGF